MTAHLLILPDAFSVCDLIFVQVNLHTYGYHHTLLQKNCIWSKKLTAWRPYSGYPATHFIAHDCNSRQPLKTLFQLTRQVKLIQKSFVVFDQIYSIINFYGIKKGAQGAFIVTGW